MASYKTFNPIISEAEYKNDLFVKIPVPCEGEVILLTGESGLLEIDTRSYKRISTRQIRTGKYNRQIRIDMTAHEISFSFSGTSSNNVNTFDFVISAMCKVKNAAVIYKTGIKDICSIVRPIVENEIKKIAICYEPADISYLRSKLTDSCFNNIVVHDGIEVLNINVNVDVDDEYKKFLKNLKNIDDNSELKKKEIELSQDLAQKGVNEAVAIYADVVNGKISLSDAAKMLKQIDNASFDENLRRLNIVKDTLFDLVEKGILTEEQAALQLALPISSAVTPSNKKQSPLLLDESANEKSSNNPYQVIDD